MQEPWEMWVGLIPGPERSPGGGNDSLLQYSCLENPVDSGVTCLLLSVLFPLCNFFYYTDDLKLKISFSLPNS